MTTIDVHLSFRDDVEVVERPDGRSDVRVGRRVLTVGPPVALCLKMLAGAGATDAVLQAEVLGHGDLKALFVWQQFVERADRLGGIRRTLYVDEVAWFTLVAASGRQARVVAPDGTSRRVRWSRFAMMRRDGSGWIAESGRGHGPLLVHSTQAMGLIAALGAGGTAEEISGATALDADAIAWGIAFCDAAALTTSLTADGTDPEETEPTLQQWEAADLYYHARSRVGRTLGGYGGSYRFADASPPVAPLPQFRSMPWTQRLVLDRPNVQSLAERDPPLQTVLEDRRSVREHGAAPVTLGQLNEFLFRSARVTAHFANSQGELTRRVYPAGGAMYELEVYVVADRCEGLASGLWYYDPLNHALASVSERTAHVEQLLEQAYYTADRRARPHLLIVITARFQRMQWKYEKMAYAAILKHVGALYQTMYLAATAMGLAPCALGGGDSDLFGEAAGLDYLVEGSVGEFILGVADPSASTGA